MKNLYTIILCLFFSSIQAQKYYYNGSEKIEIHQSKNSFISYDKPKETFTKGFKNVKTFAIKGFSIVEEEKNGIMARKFRNENLNQTTPALLLDSNSDFKLFPTKTIRIKLRTGYSKADILKLLKSNDFTEIEEKYGILRVTLKDIHKVLEIANKIYESDIAEFSIPDFYIPMELNQVNDPLFPLQFQMHNTGQVIDGVAGVNDIDVNALEAWNINLGDNVTVAVFDQGMENHEDFGNRLIGGNTPATNGNGIPLQNNATHGMNCAGVIGASDDNLGLRGVAPNVNFLSVNIFAGGTTPGDIADGIQWAIDNGADVLSNSWSYQNVSCNWTHIEIENALQNAVNNGRNGDGAVIVFSAGNTGGCVNYPARNNNVISVGAVDNRGNLFNYSSRGPELDLVAPSGETNYLGNVRTTDRMGNAGRLAGHYEPRFGGTSASCPVVSGVAALVLSVNPNLTLQEVRDILTSTATDMGAGGFDNNFGFGRVNAFLAVQQALISDLSISGGATISCSTSNNITFNLDGVINPNVTVDWSTSSNVQIISSSNTSITVTPSSLSGSAYVRANVLGNIVTEYFWLGRPRVNLTTLIPYTNAVSVYVNNNSTSEIQKQGITSVSWQKISGNGVLTPAGYFAVGQYPTTWSIYGRAIAYNQCGSTFRTFNIGWTDSNNGGGGTRPPGWLSTNAEMNKFAIFPNPVEQELYINFGELFMKRGKNSIVISDLSGKQVYQSELDNQFTSLNIGYLTSGIYILKASNGKEIRSEKLIVK